MKGNEIGTTAVPLPSDIGQAVAAGHYAEAEALIRGRLASDRVPAFMKERLRLALLHMEIMRRNYTVPEEEAAAAALELIEGITREELDRLKAEGRIDWIYLDGKVMYHESFARNLPIYRPEYGKRMRDRSWRSTPQQFEPFFDSFRDRLTDGAEIGAHIRIRHTLTLAPENVEHKKLRVHLPFPVERQQVSNVRLLHAEPEPLKLPTADEGQATVFFEAMADEVPAFSVEYEFDNRVIFHDLSLPCYAERAERAGIPAEERKYLREELPHIVLSPTVRMLAEEIVGETANPLERARKIYDYIMDSVEYSLVREYPAIDCIAEYAAVNGKGDCGVQAILFIALCRAAGIPARWQSGLMSFPGHVWNHDWAMFYVPGTGWLWCDPSMGGICRQLGREDMCRFYFGNLDPFRMPSNAELRSGFVPERIWFRFDPCDSQDGEAEYADRGLWYTKGDYRVEIEDIDIRLFGS